MAKKIRLFPITSLAASIIDPAACKRAMVDMEDVEPDNLDWYIDRDGHIWTNDAYEQHGWTFFNLSSPASKERNIKDVEVV